MTTCDPGDLFLPAFGQSMRQSSDERRLCAPLAGQQLPGAAFRIGSGGLLWREEEGTREFGWGSGVVQKSGRVGEKGETPGSGRAGCVFRGDEGRGLDADRGLI